MSSIIDLKYGKKIKVRGNKVKKDLTLKSFVLSPSLSLPLKLIDVGLKPGSITCLQQGSGQIKFSVQSPGSNPDRSGGKPVPDSLPQTKPL